MQARYIFFCLLLQGRSTQKLFVESSVRFPKYSIPMVYQHSQQEIYPFSKVSYSAKRITIGQHYFSLKRFTFFYLLFHFFIVSLFLIQMTHKHLSYPLRPLEVILPNSVRVRDLQDNDKPFILTPWAKLTGRLHHRNISRQFFLPFLLMSMILQSKKTL